MNLVLDPVLEVFNPKRPLKVGKKHHAYIAAPFFNPNQITRVALVENILEKHGFTYFSPRKVFVCPPDAPEEVRRRTFEGNHQGILDAEFLIAITDDKDMGTIWEAGVAYQANIPIIYVAFTLGKDQMFNLMLAESAYAVARTPEQLEEILLTGKPLKYIGKIE
jgi:nucleoside 2-deoxyribosyltransferase